MLINLIPDFFAALSAPDPLEAYHRYLSAHSAVLGAYWHNYVLDLDSPHAESVMLRALAADRRDLTALLARIDVPAQAQEVLSRCHDLMQIDNSIDLYLMVGVGAANAGELVVRGRGVGFICLEHFTGRPNSESYGMGLVPELIAPWIAHEVAHLVRYTSPGSRSEMARIVDEAGGNYDYWESGSHATLRELLVNEGLAVAASRAVVPGLEPWEYLGYSRRQYRRMRELDAFLQRAISTELDQRGLGYRLRYLSGGMSPSARMVSGRMIPERSGYYLGHRMVEALVGECPLPVALRASPNDCRDADERASGAQTA